VVLGHDPWQRYRLHPDHRHAGWLTVDGVVAARDPHFYPHHDVGHHRPDWLLLFEADEPDHIEDVTGFADAKVAALLAHTSQFETTMGITTADASIERDAFAERVVTDLAAVGATTGLAHAEAYRKLACG
jgi:LmbE family N-acetylglucosaminyl deacetylase